MFGFPSFQPVATYPTVASYGVNPYGANPYGAMPYGASPFGAMPYGASPYGMPTGFGAMYPSVGAAPAAYCPPARPGHGRRRGRHPHHPGMYHHQQPSWRQQITGSLYQVRDLAFYGRHRTGERALAAGTVLGATGATLGAVGASMIGLGAIGAVAGAAGGAAAAMLAARALAS